VVRVVRVADYLQILHLHLQVLFLHFFPHLHLHFFNERFFLRRVALFFFERRRFFLGETMLLTSLNNLLNALSKPILLLL